MEDKKILVLGGYGGVGQVISEQLLKETDVDIIVAGRRKERAEELSTQLGRAFPNRNISALYADASNRESLMSAFRGVNMVIVCSDTAEYADVVASAAIDSVCDYLDIHFSEAHIPKLLNLRGEIEASGRCFITQAGSHPGLAPAFVRYASSRFVNIKKVVIAGMLRIKEISLESTRSFLRDLSQSRSLVYRDCKWRKAESIDNLKVYFGAEFGKLTCYPTYIYEMEDIPSQFKIGEAGIYMSGFNWFVDWFVVIPAYFLGLTKNKLVLDILTTLTVWGLRTFTKPPIGFCYKMEAYGEMKGGEKMMEITTFHVDPYVHTAVPVVSCILQYLDGKIRKSGLWMMGHIVEPERLITDMERMGIQTKVRVADVRVR